MGTFNTKYWDSQFWANSVDPDQMPQNAASDKGLHCLPLTLAVLGRFIGTSQPLYNTIVGVHSINRVS